MPSSLRPLEVVRRPVEGKELGSANYGYEAWEDQLGGGCSLEEMLCK